MSSIEEPNFLETLRNEAKTSQPGILPKNTKFESYIGHTVINISDVVLDQDQISALEKGLTFCPTPGLPDKSQIWLDFKEFHRRLELVEFFNRDQADPTNQQINQSIIDFMNQNATDNLSDSDTETSANKELHQKFKPKSSWRPYPPNRTLDLFQRAVKQEILKSKCKPKRYNNVTKKENIGLNKLTSNPHIIIKKS